MIDATQIEHESPFSSKTLKQQATQVFGSLKEFFSNPIVYNGLRIGIFSTVFLIIVQKLSLIGWGEIYTARPSNPVFYILAIALFMIPISTEIIACRIITGCKIPNSTRNFIRKHAYNEVIFSYMGEAYLTKVISKLPDFDLRRAAIAIKDQALIRTFVANAWLIVLIALVAIVGKSDILMDFTTTSPKDVGVIALISVGLFMLLIIFFRKLTRLPKRTAIEVAGIYFLKAAAVLVVQISQWNIAIPGTEISTWLLFAVLLALSKKSPSSGELVFVSVILTIPGLDVNEAGVAAMLITATAINQFILLAMFVITSDFNGGSWLKKRARLHQLHRKQFRAVSDEHMENNLKPAELIFNKLTARHSGIS